MFDTMIECLFSKKQIKIAWIKNNTQYKTKRNKKKTKYK